MRERRWRGVGGRAALLCSNITPRFVDSLALLNDARHSTIAARKIAEHLVFVAAVAGGVHSLDRRPNERGAGSLPGIAEFGLEQRQPDALQRSAARVPPQPIDDGLLLQAPP